jgi:hypothetical protein
MEPRHLQLPDFMVLMAAIRAGIPPYSVAVFGRHPRLELPKSGGAVRSSKDLSSADALDMTIGASVRGHRVSASTIAKVHDTVVLLKEV